MKYLLPGFMLLFAANTSSLAQTSGKIHNLMISIYDHESLVPHSTRTIVITKEDGTQEMITRRENPDYSLKNFEAREDSLFILLKPYFDDGWKLISCTTVPIPIGSNTNDYITRYFLSRQQEESK